MEKISASQLRVGIFLAIGLAAVLTSILLLGGDRAFFKSHALIYAQLDQVQGLNKGSIVSISGLTVGNVKSIDFSPEKKAVVVTLKIQNEYLPRITKGSIADIRTLGALGDKFVYITPGDPSEVPLSTGDYIETSKSSDFLGVLSEKGNQAAKVFDIIDEVHRFTKIINAEGRSEKLITNLVDASQNFKITSQETKKLGQTIDRLNSVLEKIDKGEGTLGALINDSSLHERLRVILGAESKKQTIQTLIRTTIEKSPDKTGK